MSREFAHTRTGLLLYDQSKSALYGVNPCPPSSYFTKLKHDYEDADGRHYWDAMEHDKLRAWVEDSPILSEILREQYDKDVHYLFFVKKSKSQTGNSESFTLAEEGEGVTLTNVKDEDKPEQLVQVLNVGQNNSAGYKARSIRWMLARGAT